MLGFSRGVVPAYMRICKLVLTKFLQICPGYNHHVLKGASALYLSKAQTFYEKTGGPYSMITTLD
jgi:hypothetical protein